MSEPVAPAPDTSWLHRALAGVPEWARIGLAFSLGMLWDLSTLRRIDDLGDNVGLCGALFFLGLVLVFTLRLDSGRTMSKRWGVMLVILALGAAAYQVLSITLGIVDLSAVQWSRQACADGCWLPSLGASDVIDRIEAGVALVGCVCIGIAGVAMARDPGFLTRHRMGLDLFRRFMWGNILSAYVIFYYRAADVGPALLYVGLIILFLAINEWMPSRFRRGTTEQLVYQFCTFSFLLYFLPVVAAYLPKAHGGWGPIRAVILRPGTWTPFVLAALGTVATCVVLSTAANIGRPAGLGDDSPEKKRRWRLAGTVMGQVRVWMLLLAVLGGLRWMEAIPPAPLALVRQRIDARRVGPREMRCHGPLLSGVHSDLGLVQQFRFAEDRRTWLVLKAKIFSPRHMVVPVSVQWEYFDAPGWDGRWWDPNAYWHTAKGGRHVQVPGWDENGIVVRSCKRNFAVGSGGEMRKLWRITFSTPGDKSGLEFLKLLKIDVPMTQTSAADVYTKVAKGVKEASREVQAGLGWPEDDSDAQEEAGGAPDAMASDSEFSLEQGNFTLLSDRSAGDNEERLSGNLSVDMLSTPHVGALADQGIPVDEESAPQILDLFTTDAYKIGRTYLWLEADG